MNNININKRPRRLRYHPILREIVQETRLHPSNLIMPIFIIEGKNIKYPIKSMPGQYQWSIDQALIILKQWIGNGVHSIILFGIPENKDEVGNEALTPDGISIKAIKEIKEAFPNLFIISDICFCEYTNHGHCGIIKNKEVDNDETLHLLAKQSLLHVQAGSDMIAPSGMIDGMVGVIRDKLDAHNFQTKPIMSYAVKYASSFYGPFREAVDSGLSFGDRKSYQMHIGNSREAIKEAALDVEQGADILLVKPAQFYLDIIYQLKEKFYLPIAAYQVSGEYLMIKLASAQGVINEKNAVIESLTSMKRAGADIIISYFTESIIKEL